MSAITRRPDLQVGRADPTIMLVSFDLTAPTSSSEASLVKSIGTFGLAAGIVNVTIGGGIFRLPADMAATLGPTAPIAYLLCAVVMGLVVLCMAEAGSRVSLTGGVYAYVGVAFGPFAGFLTGFLLWMVMTFVMAAVATVLMASLGALVPALASRGASAAVIVVVYGVFATINILGVSRGANVNTALTVAKILPLLLLMAGGLFAIDSANLVIADPPTIATLARSSILLIFAFAGIEAALTPGGELRNPARTVPAAIFIAMVTITALYAGLQFVAQGVLGPGLAASKAAPLAEAAGVAMGGWARNLLLVGAVVSMLGHVGGMILAAPRTVFAFARDGFLPPATCTTASRPSIACRRDHLPVHDRAGAGNHQHLRETGDPGQRRNPGGVRDVLCRELAIASAGCSGRRHTVQGSRTDACHRSRLPGDRLDADQRHAGGVGCVRDRAGSRGGDLRAAPSNLSQSQPQDHNAHLAGAGSATGTARTMKRWGAEPTW